MRILVAEDTQSLQKLMEDFGSKRGHAVTVVMDGETALTFLQSNLEFDALITDNSMGPGKMSGVELIRSARGLAHRADMPMVLFTSDDPQGFAEEFAGWKVELVRKPASPSLAYERVEKLFS